MSERRLPTQGEVESYLRDRRNWGRWGKDDQVGAINLITAQKRLSAVGLVRKGKAVSLSRFFPKTAGPTNANPAQHYMRRADREKGGAATDYYGIAYHGVSATHIDALCHMWDQDGMWNGRDAAREVTFDGTNWGSIEHWSDGIITRGVLLDVPKHRGRPYVTQEDPVHGWELEDIASAQGVALQPGDALVVYSGYDNWRAADPDLPYGLGTPRPGLHASCLPFIRDNDVAVLVWDMMDLTPSGYDVPFTVHGSIFSYGVALLDNAMLEPLAQACQEEGRYEFMLMIAPLRVAGGTGSPVNPIAMF